MSKYTPEACARAGIPYDPEWREVMPGKEYSKMQFWEVAYQNVLLAEEPVHARKERGIYEHANARTLVPILNPDGTVTHLTPEYWRHEWRSLPGYDGPPMRAPSGVQWVVDAVTGLLAGEPMCVAEVPLAMRFGEVEEDPMPSSRELRERFVIGKYEAIFGAPSAGGRGWCPKLARVGE